MFTITVTDSGVIDAFNRLIAFGESPQPALKAIGEKMLEFTKERFVSSTDPYGNAWAENTDVTLRAFLNKKSEKHFRKTKEIYWGSYADLRKLIKAGVDVNKHPDYSEHDLSKLGLKLLGSKNPLIGHTRDLSTKFNPTVIGDNLVTVSSPKIYAAMQQFGGTKKKFPHLWGDIPARPFFPDPARGLPEPYQRSISEVLRIALTNAKNGS